MDRISILNDASGVWAVAKPAGIATQAPPGIPSVEAWARGRRAASDYVGVPHRLDRAVSGVLLLATTPRAARKLSRQFERRQVGKTYLAVVAPAGGIPSSVGCDPTEWRDLVAKLPDEPRGRIVTVESEGPGREAVTRVRMLQEGEAEGEVRWLLELEPLTGRMHQLRLQSAARGMPVVGDGLYGGPPLPRQVMMSDDPRTAPILLHAWKIRYLDPETGEPTEITAPPPAYWPLPLGPR